METEKLGVWAFYAGLVIAVVAAIMSPSGLGGLAILVLGALGIVVGLLNVTGKEVNTFLIAALALMLSTSSLRLILEAIPAVGAFVPAFLIAVNVFVAPGAAVVALKAIWDITRSK